ncbi:MAG: prolyl oligopeptidase family serine peptidase [Bacteroidales bacterium]|nr:prolyl oligopeptidase family serine peptidase [Bacteroidales bacterium]
MKKYLAFLISCVVLSVIITDCQSPAPKDPRVFDITYQTPGVDGTMLTASGIIMIPPAGNGPFPLLSAQHGTIFDRHVAPSYLDSCIEAQAWLMEVAAKGYVVVMADYIGLGKEGTTLHPYFHTQTEATATRDMIRAAREFCTAQGFLLDDRLFLVGYSQGGHVTASLQRLLEQDHPDEFRITASAIMAAPLDLTMLFEHHVTTPNAISPALTSLISNTFNWIYTLVPDPIEIFQPPYDTLVPVLLDFNHPEATVIQTLNTPPVNIFQPQFLETVSAGTNPFNAALDANQAFDWSPKAPTILVYSMADEVIPFAIGEKAYATMLDLGGNVDTINTGNIYNHGDGFLPALMKAKEWFDTFE